MILHRETGDTRYKIAATKIRDRLKTYPRTKDGGFWHATSTTTTNAAGSTRTGGVPPRAGVRR